MPPLEVGMSAPAVCPWCWGDHVACPYSAVEAAAVRKARKARSSRRTGRDSGSPGPHGVDAQTGADFPHEFRNVEHEAGPSLAEARRRLSRAGRPPTDAPSRFARFRRRHPDYVERERARLERLRRRPEAQGEPSSPGAPPAHARSVTGGRGGRANSSPRWPRGRSATGAAGKCRRATTLSRRPSPTSASPAINPQTRAPHPPERSPDASHDVDAC